MNSEEAREKLLLFRPDTADANDPEFAEALREMAADAELQRWFKEHCARQALIRDRLRHIAVPVDLRQRILDNVAQAIRPVIWWRRPEFRVWAAAAAIVLAIGMVLLWPRADKSNNFAAYRNRMVRTAQRMYRMDMVTNNLVEIRRYLADHRGHSDYVLPPALEKLPGDGCAILSWRANLVSLVCFDLGNHRDLYLFVIDRSSLPDPPELGPPQFKRIGRLTSASWGSGDRAYILAGPGDEEFVQRYLQ